MASRGDQLHRRFGSDQARQALGAAGAGQDADLHFGETHLGARHGDAVMAGERHLEPAAERIAMDRRDHRFRAVVEHVVGAPAGWRGGRPAELADVGAGDKAAAGADQHHGLDRWVGIAAVDRTDDALRHAGRQRVDRRVVDRDDTNIAILLETDQLAFSHFRSPRRCTSEAVRR